MSEEGLFYIPSFLNQEIKVAPKNNIQEGKPRPSLLPMDILIKHLLPAYEEGVTKYERESWRQGFYVSTLFDAAQRHLNDFFYLGHDIDVNSSTKKHHLAGALFSILSILHTLDTRPELDDRFAKKSIQQAGTPENEFEELLIRIEEDRG